MSNELPKTAPEAMLYLYKVKFSSAQTNVPLSGWMAAAETPHGSVNVLSLLKVAESYNSTFLPSDRIRSLPSRDTSMLDGVCAKESEEIWPPVFMSHTFRVLSSEVLSTLVESSRKMHFLMFEVCPEKTVGS